MPSAHNTPIVELSTLVSNLSPQQKEAIKSGKPVIVDLPDKSLKPVGRPCDFCSNKEHILKETQKYLDSGNAMKTEKPRMMFLNELALILGQHRDTISDWRNKKLPNGEPEHPEFIRMIKVLETNQELGLQKRTMGRYNPTGAIFLLKTKHGYMETEKQVLAGDKNEPLEIVITKEEVRNASED